MRISAPLFASEPLETLRTWLALHTVASYAPFLSSAIVEEEFDFTGRSVIVTGAARGIGAEVAKFFHEAGAANVIEAAYRFVRHEPGVDVTLFGTGDAAHLRTNIASLLKAPLPQADRDKLTALFGHLAIGVGLDSNLGPAAARFRAAGDTHAPTPQGRAPTPAAPPWTTGANALLRR